MYDRRVLIVDSDMSLLEQHTMFLIRYGWHVATATNGIECLAQWRSFRPEILVLDPDIPWGGGDGVLAVIEGENCGPNLRVVLLTAEPQLEEVWRTLEYPISDLAIKPIDPYDLSRRITHVLCPQERDNCLQRLATSSDSRSARKTIRIESAVEDGETSPRKPLAHRDACRSTRRRKTFA